MIIVFGASNKCWRDTLLLCKKPFKGRLFLFMVCDFCRLYFPLLAGWRWRPDWPAQQTKIWKKGVCRLVITTALALLVFLSELRGLPIGLKFKCDEEMAFKSFEHLAPLDIASWLAAAAGSGHSVRWKELLRTTRTHSEKPCLSLRSKLLQIWDLGFLPTSCKFFKFNKFCDFPELKNVLNISQNWPMAKSMSELLVS